MKADSLEAKGIAIIALGNRFRGDDGVGVEIAKHLEPLPSGCTFTESPGDALGLLDLWQDSALTIVLDAAVSGAPPGTIHHLGDGQQATPKDLARCSSHGFGLAEAMALAKALGHTPGSLSIYAVEAGNLEPGAGLSAEVAVAAKAVAQQILSQINSRISAN